MQLVKMGRGKAKGFADLARVSLTILTKSEYEIGLLGKYLLDYDVTKGGLEKFLEKNQVELSFESYHMSKKMKTVEETVNGKTEKRSEVEYYYIRGEFSLELPIEDDERLIVAEFIDAIEKIRKNIQSVSYHISFALSEAKSSELSAEATNNALDNIKIEVTRIANHLGLNNIELLGIDFTGNAFDGDAMYKCANSGLETRIQRLEEMLEGKEIEVSSSFVSTWGIS